MKNQVLTAQAKDLLKHLKESDHDQKNLLIALQKASKIISEIAEILNKIED